MSRLLQTITLIVLATSAVTPASGSPVVEKNLVARQDVQNIVYVTDANTFWRVERVFCASRWLSDCVLDEV